MATCSDWRGRRHQISPPPSLPRPTGTRSRSLAVGTLRALASGGREDSGLVSAEGKGQGRAQPPAGAATVPGDGTHTSRHLRGLGGPAAASSRQNGPRGRRRCSGSQRARRGRRRQATTGTRVPPARVPPCPPSRGTPALHSQSAGPPPPPGLCSQPRREPWTPGPRSPAPPASVRAQAAGPRMCGCPCPACGSVSADDPQPFPRHLQGAPSPSVQPEVPLRVRVHSQAPHLGPQSCWALVTLRLPSAPQQ